MDAKRVRRGFTLVELLVVIGIIVMLGCLILPSMRTAREPSRRNSCLNNIKQISLALLTYEDARESLPLASTTYFNANGESASVVGSADDGYSWLFQVLPHLESSNIYELISESQSQIGPAGDLGAGSQKLRQGPFVPQVVVNPNVQGIESLAGMQQVEAFICPSYPGADFTKGQIYNGNHAAVGNYVAIPSTHYNFDGAKPSGCDEGEFPKYSLFGSHSSAGPKRWAGNGVLVFAQLQADDTVDEAGKPLRSVLQKPANGAKSKGINTQQISDGASQTIMFAESREERYASWISGLSAYVVAADPRGPGGGVTRLKAKTDSDVTLLGWSESDDEGQTALNVGMQVKRAKDKTAELYYDHQFVHADAASEAAQRVYGPSSAHPGIVLHGFADGHGKSINDDIDRDVYLHLVTRAGGEEIDSGW